MTHLLRSASVLTLAVVLSGCVTAPPAALKPQDVPQAFTAPVPDATAPVWPQAEWWKGFGSDEMSALVDDARVNNLDLAAAAARVLQAEARSEIAGSSLFPQIGASAGAQRSGAKHGPGVNNLNAGLNASYMVDFWGEARANLKAATESEKAANFSRQTVELSVISGTADAYLNVLALRERLAIAKDNIEAARRVLSITQAKVDNGVSSRLDLAQQTAQLAGQEAQIPALEQQEREARYALSLLLARVPEGFDVKAQNLDDIKTPLIAPGIPSELLRRRPDVAQAEASLAAAHANVDAARAAFFPSINLTGSAGYASAALSTLFNGGNLAWSIGGSLLQTIFDGGRLLGESRLARAERQELIADYRSSVLNAFSDVETSLGQVSSLAEQEKFTKEQADNAAEAFRISEIQYREGVTDLLAVLQAQQTLFTAQDRLVQIKVARVQAVIGLYNSLGGGWQEAEDDVTQPIPVPVAKPAQ